MTQYSRLCIAAVLLSCLTVPAWGTAAPADALRQPVLQTATQPETPDAPGAPASSEAGAESLLDLRLGTTGEAVALTIQVSGLPTYNTFSLDGGRRLVIDLRNTLNLKDGAHLEAEGDGLLLGVRTSLFSKEPEVVSRLVLDLKRPCDFALSREQDRILVQLTEKSDDQVARLAGQLSSPSCTVALVAQPSTAVAERSESPREAPRTPTAGRLDALVGQLAQLVEPRHSLASQPVRPAVIRNEAPRTAPKRVSRLVAELSEVAAAQVEVGIAAQFQDAQVVVEGDQEPAAEEQPAAEETSPAEEPMPPGPRIERSPVDAEANRNFTSVLRNLRAGTAPDGASGVDTMAEMQPFDSVAAVAAEGAAEPQPSAPVYQGDPLYQPVDLDLRDAELSHVVAMLANMAGINVMGGADLTGPVSITLNQVPLKQAMETTLSLNDLGLINKSGIYYIVSYDEAMQAQRRTAMVEFQNAQAADIQAVMESILQGDQDQDYIDLASHEAANTLIIAAPEGRIDELVQLARQMDVTETLPPMITVSLPVNWADPKELTPIVQGALTSQEGLAGTVAADPRGRSLIVTDQPVVIEQVRELVARLDTPVKQVYIDAMIVDVQLQDAAETGVDWLLRAVRSQSRRDAALGTGRTVGNLQQLDLTSDLNLGEKAGILAFDVLSADIDWSGIIQAEVRNDDGHLVSRPQLITQENTPATITISQEIPYRELTETAAGGSQTSTAFKDIGTDLTVTPRVTHDNHIMVKLEVKESDTGAIFSGIPIENKRFMSTSSMVKSGHTLLVGGLRRNNNDASIRKVPVLGDVPVLNFLFRSNIRNENVNELLVFLTCHVLEDDPVLTDYQAEKYEYGLNQKTGVDASNTVLKNIVRPNDARTPIWRSGDDAEDMDDEEGEEEGEEDDD